MISLPFTCQHEHYEAGAENDWGNTEPGWADPVDVPCFWQPGQVTENSVESLGGVRTIVDLTLFVESSLVVDPQDRFTVAGRTFEVIGLPKEYDHGPFGYRPDRQLVELKWVG